MNGEWNSITLTHYDLLLVFTCYLWQVSTNPLKGHLARHDLKYLLAPYGRMENILEHKWHYYHIKQANNDIDYPKHLSASLHLRLCKLVLVLPVVNKNRD